MNPTGQEKWERRGYNTFRKEERDSGHPSFLLSWLCFRKRLSLKMKLFLLLLATFPCCSFLIWSRYHCSTKKSSFFLFFRKGPPKFEFLAAHSILFIWLCATILSIRVVHTPVRWWLSESWNSKYQIWAKYSQEKFIVQLFLQYNSNKVTFLLFFGEGWRIEMPGAAGKERKRSKNDQKVEKEEGGGDDDDGKRTFDLCRRRGASLVRWCRQQK